MARSILLASRLAFAGAATLLLPSTASAEPEKTPPVSSEGLQVVISLNEQRLEVFRGMQTIATSNISSGKHGHSTPTGVFSILSKRRFHRSNIYSNAPMPFMQRLTWTGIALHGSDSVPAYAASHGCVRLPQGFDEKLFSLTSKGAHVIVNSEMVRPQSVEHPLLFQPRAARVYDANKDHWLLRLETGGTLETTPGPDIATARLLEPVRGEIGLDGKHAEDEPPLRVLISRRSLRDVSKDIQTLLNELGFEAGVVDGALGPNSRGAIRRFQEENDLAPTGSVSKKFIAALYEAAGKSEPENARLFVRRNFEPVFDAPVSIKLPEQPLGTHLLVATNYDDDNKRTGWNAFTLENRLSANSRAYYGIDTDAGDDVDLSDALERIAISPELRAKVEKMLTPGSSIVIADNGVERYTGWKTDFAVNTRIDRTYKAARAEPRREVREQRRAVPRYTGSVYPSRRNYYQRPAPRYYFQNQPRYYGYQGQPRYYGYQGRPRYFYRGY